MLNFSRLKNFWARLKRTPRVNISLPRRSTLVFPFRIISILVILTLFILSIFLSLRSDLFLVRKFSIEINGSTLAKGFVSQTFITTNLNEWLARSIFFTNTRLVEEKLEKTSLVIKKVVVNMLFPDTLRVEVRLRDPVAAVYMKKERFIIDETGLLFAPMPANFSLPEFRLSGNLSISLGNQLDAVSTSSVVEVITKLKDNSFIKIGEIDLNPEGVIMISSTTGLIVYLKGNDSIGEDINNLLAILKSQGNGKKIKTIDLRFERPVITFE